MQTKLNPYISFKDGDTTPGDAILQDGFWRRAHHEYIQRIWPLKTLRKKNLIMHSMLETENGMTIMASKHAESDGISPGHKLQRVAQRR